MRIRSSETDTGDVINMSSLLDVLFILIIFFLVTTTFKKQEDDHRIDLPALHEMTTRVVDDHRVRDTHLAQLEGGQAGPLIARAGLIDPDMDIDSCVPCSINRGSSAAIIDKGQPAGIAMGQDVDALSSLFLPRLQQY